MRGREGKTGLERIINRQGFSCKNKNIYINLGYSNSGFSELSSRAENDYAEWDCFERNEEHEGTA